MFLNKTYRLWSSIIALVIAVALTGAAFVASQLETVETAPETGAPSQSEAAEVSRLKKEFPVESGTALFLVYSSESKLSDSQIETINENLIDIYAEHTDIPFAPQAQV